MKKFREPEARDQMMLLPRRVDDYVGKNDLVRYVDLMIDELNLEAIEKQYSYGGRPAYQPSVLVKILLYGKLRGIRSSRELCTACRENLRFIFLASNERPDFRTISDFRKRFHRELSCLLKQTIEIGVQEQVIGLEHVAIDGTKVGAFAGARSFREPKHFEKLLLHLEKELGGSFEADMAAEEAQEGRGVDLMEEIVLPEGLQEKVALRGKIKAALTHYDDIDREKPDQISLTDPECRFMKAKGIIPCYTGMAAVDAQSGMVVAGYATNAVSDNDELVQCLEEIKENTGSNPKVITADKAFRAHEGLLNLKQRNIDGYIPQVDEEGGRFTLKDFQYDVTTDSYICPHNERLERRGFNKERNYNIYKCEQCPSCPLLAQCMPHGGTKRTLNVSIHAPLVAEMRQKTTSAIGKAMAKIRASTVEPTFGYIKASKKLRQFLFRGMNMINAMWKFELAAYNLEKLAKIIAQEDKLMPT